MGLTDPFISIFGGGYLLAKMASESLQTSGAESYRYEVNRLADAGAEKWKARLVDKKRETELLDMIDREPKKWRRLVEETQEELDDIFGYSAWCVSFRVKYWESNVPIIRHILAKEGKLYSKDANYDGIAIDFVVCTEESGRMSAESYRKPFEAAIKYVKWMDRQINHCDVLELMYRNKWYGNEYPVSSLNLEKVNPLSPYGGGKEYYLFWNVFGKQTYKQIYNAYFYGDLTADEMRRVFGYAPDIGITARCANSIVRALAGSKFPYYTEDKKDLLKKSPKGLTKQLNGEKKGVLYTSSLGQFAAEAQRSKNAVKPGDTAQTETQSEANTGSEDEQ